MGALNSDTGTARSRFIDAKLERYGFDQNTIRYRQCTRSMWKAARDVLQGTSQDKLIDTEVAGWLMHTIDELLANQTPLEIEHALERGKGAAPDRLDIKEAKSYAILYVQAAKNGDIEDRSPIKTIASMYNCSKQAVRDWSKQCPDVKWAEYQKHRTMGQRIDSVKRLLKFNAKHFRESSRTQPAINQRLRKAQTK